MVHDALADLLEGSGESFHLSASRGPGIAHVVVLQDAVRILGKRIIGFVNGEETRIAGVGILSWAVEGGTEFLPGSCGGSVDERAARKRKMMVLTCQPW